MKRRTRKRARTKPTMTTMTTMTRGSSRTGGRGGLAGAVEQGGEGVEQRHDGRVRQRIVLVEAQARQHRRPRRVAEGAPQLVQRHHACTSPRCSQQVAVVCRGQPGYSYAGTQDGPSEQQNEGNNVLSLENKIGTECADCRLPVPRLICGEALQGEVKGGPVGAGAAPEEPPKRRTPSSPTSRRARARARRVTASRATAPHPLSAIDFVSSTATTTCPPGRPQRFGHVSRGPHSSASGLKG